MGSGKSTLVLGLLGELSGQGEVSVKGSKALCGQEYLGVKGLKEDWPYVDPRSYCGMFIAYVCIFYIYI